MFRNITVLILLVLCELIQSYRSKAEKEFLSEINNEEFFLSLIQESPKIANLEGSGAHEGSGTILETDAEDIKTCIEIGYTSVCSNRGKCVNNKCICNSAHIEMDNNTVLYRHSGRYCEECQYCRAQRCHQYLPCIECNLFQKNADCYPYCQFQYEIVDKVVGNMENDEKFCDIENSDGCFFKFKYHYNSQNSVLVQYEKDIFCFDGQKFIIFSFLGVIIYIFGLTLLVPRICSASRGSINNIIC